MLLAIAVVSMGACSDDDETSTNELELTPKYLYLAVSGADEIAGYTVNPKTGALTVLDNSPWATSVSLPRQLAVHPDNTYLYVAGNGADELGAMEIDPDTGDLTEVDGSPYGVNLTSGEIAISSDGSHLYSFSLGGTTAYVWETEDNGTLTQVQSTLGMVNPVSMALSHSGDFLIVGDTPGALLRVFYVTSGGGLAIVDGSPFAIADTPVDIEFSPDDQFVFVSENTNERVYSFEFDSTTGALTATSPASYATGGTSIEKLAADPSGEYLYVSGSNSVFILEIDVDGTLSAASTSSISVSGDALGMMFDSTGTYLYRAEVSNNELFVYERNESTGALTEISDSSYVTGANPGAAVIVYEYE